MGSIFLIPIFAQTFLGYDATATGYLFLPMAAMMMISAQIGGRLSGKLQPRLIIMISTAIAAVGLFLFSFLDARSGVLDITIPLGIMAFGMGLGMAQRTNIIAVVVPRSEIGIASSILALARNIAGAFGIAIFGSILNSSIENNLIKISGLSSFHGNTVVQYQEFVAMIVLKSQISAYHTVFIVSSVIVFAGAILAIYIGDIKMKKGVQVHVEA
jgi:predicted MFS family arabinose efflux permease